MKRFPFELGALAYREGGSYGKSASVGGHPIHPIIIPFPIGLWVFSPVAYVIYLWRGNSIWKDWISFYPLLGGIVGAALAAVFGIIDWQISQLFFAAVRFRFLRPENPLGAVCMFLSTR